MKNVLLFSWFGVAALVTAAPARAEETSRATFALIVGSNHSVDKDLAPLKYADDDAARYLDLFRLLGARTYLLTRLDDNTRRIHPQAAAEAVEPKKARFESALAQLSADVAQAAARNVETTVYVVYAGHGNVQNGQGYITLEDARLTGADLAMAFAKIPATRIHLIADACASYFLAYGRGAGGERRPVEKFSTGPELAADARIGLLLSTSSARESHEWDAFQSGVFSHEVRSGLYGAADADGDGQVTYREIAAFVARANASVPNERYRPDVHTREPRGGGALVDIRRARGRRLDIDGRHAGHYYIEDGRGVRVLDLHNAEGQALSVVRPAPTGPVFLRRIDDDKEFVLPSAEEVVALTDLPEGEPRAAARGAAHESFNELFALPFDRSVVDTYQAPPASLVESIPTTERGMSGRRALGLGAAGLAVAFAGAGVYFTLSASSIKRDLSPTASNAEATSTNDRISASNTAGVIAFAVSGAMLTTGAVLFFWPSAKGVQPIALPGGGFVGYRAQF